MDFHSTNGHYSGFTDPENGIVYSEQDITKFNILDFSWRHVHFILLDKKSEKDLLTVE